MISRSSSDKCAKASVIGVSVTADAGGRLSSRASAATVVDLFRVVSRVRRRTVSCDAEQPWPCLTFTCGDLVSFVPRDQKGLSQTVGRVVGIRGATQQVGKQFAGGVVVERPELFRRHLLGLFLAIVGGGPWYGCKPPPGSELIEFTIAVCRLNDADESLSGGHLTDGPQTGHRVLEHVAGPAIDDDRRHRPGAAAIPGATRPDVADRKPGSSADVPAVTEHPHSRDVSEILKRGCALTSGRRLLEKELKLGEQPQAALLLNLGSVFRRRVRSCGRR